MRTEREAAAHPLRLQARLLAEKLVVVQSLSRQLQQPGAGGKQLKYQQS